MRNLLSLIVLVVVLLVVSNVNASLIQVKIGEGRPYIATLVSGNIGTYNSNDTFLTFCLEKDEHAKANKVYDVEGIEDYAFKGGVNTDTGDYISDETAWLYTSLINSSLIVPSGYTTYQIGVGLQDAIWALEEEQLGTWFALGTYFKQKAIEAVLAGWKNDGTIKSMNLVDKSFNQEQEEYYVQSFLVSIPEPITVLILGMGGLFIRRF